MEKLQTLGPVFVAEDFAPSKLVRKEDGTERLQARHWMSGSEPRCEDGNPAEPSNAPVAASQRSCRPALQVSQGTRPSTEQVQLQVSLDVKRPAWPCPAATQQELGGSR